MELDQEDNGWRYKQNLESVNNDFTSALGGRFLLKDEKNAYFIMNNHRLAYGVWKRFLMTKSCGNRIILLHIDAHPDAVIDKDMLHYLPKELSEIDHFENEWLQFENFIYPFLYECGEGAKIFTLCRQSQVRGVFNKDCKLNFKFENFVDQESFCKSVMGISSKSILFLDIDIDYFYPSDEGDSIVSDVEIKTFLNHLFTSLPKRPDIIIVATSPSCYHVDENDVPDDKSRAEYVLPFVERIQAVVREEIEMFFEI